MASQSGSFNNSNNPFATFYKNPLYLSLKNHFYNYLVRRRRIHHVLDKYPPSGIVLEMGSGISAMIMGEKNVIYSDLSHDSALMLKRYYPASHTLQMDSTEISFTSNSISTVICSEVLEHIADDLRALHEMHRILEPNGRLILTVPAHSAFYAFDDSFVNHLRRYNPHMLISELQKIGFQSINLQKVSGIFDKVGLYCAARLYALRSKGSGKAEPPSIESCTGMGFFFFIYKILNYLLALIVQLEMVICPLAFTTIILITCKKGSLRESTHE